MKRLLTLVVSLLAAAAIMLGGLVPQAHAEGKFGKYKSEQSFSLGHVQTAGDTGKAKYKAAPAGKYKAPAGSPSTWGSTVNNMAGAKVRFAYKVPGKVKTKNLYECLSYATCPDHGPDYKNWSSWPTTASPYKFKVIGDARFVHVAGPGIADGWYMISGYNIGVYHHWQHRFTTITVREWNYKGKSTKGELPQIW